MAAVCRRTGLPLAWRVETARAHESNFAAGLIDTARARGFAVETCALDKGYDTRAIYADCAERGVGRSSRCAGPRVVKRGEPSRHRVSTARGGSPDPTTSARQPSGAARPASASPRQPWVKADRLHPLIPRETLRWRDLYRAARRRAGVRTAQARMGAAPAPRPWHRARPASRRPDDPRQAGLRRTEQFRARRIGDRRVRRSALPARQ